jgi:N-acetylneuraminate lyase
VSEVRRIAGGLWPAVLTPFEESGAPALDVFEQLVDTLIREGVDGLYLLGSTGQGPAMPAPQRKQVLERGVAVAAGRVPVMVHVGAISTRESIELAEHAASAGADAVSSVPPIYFPSGPDAVFEHYRRIAAATELPFYPYHHAMFGDAVLRDADYPRRLLEIPHIAGMKVTITDLYVFGVLERATAGRLRLFSGADELLCHAALSGAVGAIGTSYNLWGPACKAARSAIVGGDFDGARRFMAAFQSAIAEILATGDFYGFLRSAMKLKYDLDIGPGQSPSSFAKTSWSCEDVARLVSAVDEAVELPAGSS